MYRKDKDCEFVDAEKMKVHKPTWLFYGNECYVFLNHFCGVYVGVVTSGSGVEMKSITLQSLLFYKQRKNILELVTTFGCYNRDSICSYEKVKQVFFQF